MNRMVDGRASPEPGAQSKGPVLCLPGEEARRSIRNYVCLLQRAPGSSVVAAL
jgi:hypothetical protein